MKKLLKSTENWLYVGIDPEIRISRGLTQKELADLTLGEISVRTIQNYENGTTDIGAKNLLLLSEILETTPSTLLKVPVENI
ncbi:MAG: helix-turn-helix domain-containing protein [Acholeplasmatales bacterium]